MTEAFSVRVDATSHEEPVVAVSGEIDIASAPRLKRQLIELAHGAPTAIVIDMSDVSFMDSTGLVVLSLSRKQLEHNGGKLILAGLQPQILRLLQLAGLDDVFSIVSTRPQALPDAGE